MNSRSRRKFPDKQYVLPIAPAEELTTVFKKVVVTSVIDGKKIEDEIDKEFVTSVKSEMIDQRISADCFHISNRIENGALGKTITDFIPLTLEQVEVQAKAFDADLNSFKERVNTKVETSNTVENE